jgi:hypothetical protein
MTSKHLAYNVITGEVLGSNTGSALRRHLKVVNASAIRYGFPTGKWVFCHDYGKKWEQGGLPC